MKAAESPGTEQIKPLDHVIVGVGRIFVRAHIEDVLVPSKGLTPYSQSRWVSRYRVDKPANDIAAKDRADVVHVEKNIENKAYYWNDHAHRVSYRGPTLFVPHIFADEHFVALNGFASQSGGGCSIKDSREHRVITNVHFSNDSAVAAVIGLLTLDERMGSPQPRTLSIK